MVAYPQCIPCLVNQGLNAVKKLGLGEEKEKEIAIKAIKFLSSFERIDKSPAYYAYFVQRIVKEVAGTEDPFKDQKKMANKKALEVLPALEKMLSRAEDPLSFALKVSAAGNSVDFAVKGEVKLEEVLKLLNEDFAVWDYEAFRNRLEDSKKVLIIGDNAGEIVLDKILVKVLKGRGLEVTYAVKGGPILNDATMEDAIEVGMTKLCRVIENGSDKVGTWLEDCSKEFKEVFYSSDVVISKGQANFETLSSAEREIFFLLVAKCEPIGKETGSKKGSLVFMRKI